MKKVLIILVTLAIFFAIPFAVAQPQEKTKSPLSPIGNFIERALGPIFYDFAERVPGASFYMWIRIMLFFFLFAVLFGAASMIPWLRDAAMKRIRVVITLVIALIMSIMMPNVFVDAIARTYGIIAIFVFMMLPVAGIIYLAYVIFPTGTDAVNLKGEALTDSQRRFNHLVKAVLFFLLMTIIHNFGVAIKSYGLAENIDWIEWAGIAEGVSGIMFLWHGFAALFFNFGREEGEGFYDSIGRRMKEAIGFAPRAAEETPETYPMHLRESIARFEEALKELSARMFNMVASCNIVLQQNREGQIKDNARIAAEDSASSIESMLKEIENLIKIIQSDARFAELNKTDKARFENAISNYTDALIKIKNIETQYENNLLNNLGPIKSF